ncbi:translation initiation factor 4G, partial [Lecanoromycetidae sp. Uapishka_2]
MTSISQPVLPPQAPNNAASSQAAGSAGRTSYASATKKTISPSSASGSSTPSAAASSSQNGKQDVNSAVNGKAIQPAVPAAGTPTITNGNTPTSSTSGLGDHTRKPSVTISAAGASGYMPNGGPVAGKPKGGNNIQFGSVAEGSPAAANATPAPNQSTNSLAVNGPANPRVTSPSTSPSPIPQPPPSGGRPPSSLHGNSNSMSFGSFGGAEANMRPSGTPQGPLAPQTQPSHLRRESSQPQHSDSLSNQGMGPGAGRGGYSQGGRGRGSFQGQYQQQVGQGYPFPPNNRAPPNQPRGGPNMAPYQGQGRNLQPYPNSPHQAARSPSLANAQPALAQPGQPPMGSPMAQPPYGYPNPYGQYPQNMGPPQVNPHSPKSLKGNAPRFARPPSRGRGNARTFPDLSPASGNFEQILTARYQNQYMQQGYDPNYMQNYYNSGFYGGYPPPTSPRPPHQMTPGPQQAPFHSGQYGNQQQPSPMSRTSSAISHTDRPASSMGRQQTATPASNNTAVASRTANSPAPKPNTSFGIPPKKKSAALVIKDPNTGEAVTLDKPAAPPAPPSKSQTPAVTSTPTPPPRAPSHADSQHSRAESKSVKSDAEKRNDMREAIAKKMEEDKAEEQRKKNEIDSKAAQEKKDAEDKLLKEKEDADAKQREAAVAQMKAEEAEQKSKADAEEAEKAAAEAQKVADEAAEKARKDKELEDELARWEAEDAEKERQEAEEEAAYQAKKKAKKEEDDRKKAEEAQMADDAMKKAEQEAEEAEEARLRELEKGEGEESQKERVDMFAALKKDGGASPASVDTPAAEETPNASGVATPASEAPTAAPKPPAFGGKQKPAALKLETTKKDIEQPQPSAALTSLRTSRRIMDIKEMSYPDSITPPTPALNSPKPGQNTAAGKMGQFKYNREFLLQFQQVFKEAPSENWTDRVRETVGDSTEPSSARATPRSTGGGSMGMAGRQTSNRAPMQQAPMGIFAAPGGRTLPSGTTSQQRFEAASRNPAPARQSMQNPLAPFVGRPGGFPQPGAPGVKMDRTPSNSMAHPNSPRNASQRGGSQRGSRAAPRREDPKDNKAMPLTAGANLKPIEVTSSGWKPRSVGNAAGMAGPAPGGEGHMDPELVQRKVKSHLNKLTPNNFDKITLQLLDISAQSKDESDGRTLRQVIQLTFEKATDEAHWAEMYAQFCKRMLESMSPEVKDENILDKKGEVVHGGALFRKYLLNRCQEEFEKGWKLNIGDKPEGESDEAVMLSDAYYKEAAAKRRGLGLVRFIGELYKLSMLTERIMHECVKKLVDYQGMPDEAEVESLTSLLRTIGQRLDTASNIPNGPQMMSAYFTKISQMIVIEGLPSRLRFMLMDIVELRAKGWQGKGGAIKGPMTIDEVRAQVQQQDREKEMQRQADNSRRGGGGGGGRPPIGRGDARNFSGGAQYGMMPPPDYRNTVGVDDLRRLGSKGSSRQVSSQGQQTFGPSSMFSGPRGSRTGRPGMAAATKDDSGASSRTGTPPALKEKKEKEEKEAASRTNTFSALAGLESSEATENASPATSPPTAKSQPVERSRSPKGKNEESKPETS